MLYMVVNAAAASDEAAEGVEVKALSSFVSFSMFSFDIKKHDIFFPGISSRVVLAELAVTLLLLPIKT